jgi:hypothetical protein
MKNIKELFVPNIVTTFSKILAVVIFVVFPFIGFWLGFNYGYQFGFINGGTYLNDDLQSDAFNSDNIINKLTTNIKKFQSKELGIQFDYPDDYEIITSFGENKYVVAKSNDGVSGLVFELPNKWGPEFCWYDDTSLEYPDKVLERYYQKNKNQIKNLALKKNEYFQVQSPNKKVSFRVDTSFGLNGNLGLDLLADKYTMKVCVNHSEQNYNQDWSVEDIKMYSQIYTEEYLNGMVYYFVKDKATYRDRIDSLNRILVTLSKN